jgi:Ca-activated chloride channel family protein
MSFLAPLSLLWLLLLAPMILFFYLLKLKRREVEVSSVYLWSQLIKDVQANSPFQKLRKNLLLLLQLLVVGFLVFGLARPFLSVRALGGENVVVILDGSASMQSRDEGSGALPAGSRFDAAKRAVLRMVEGMGQGDAMMILLATSRTRVLAPFTSDQGELRAALTRARPRDTATNLREAVALALSASRARRATRSDANQIFVLSDGAFGELDEISLEGARIDFLKFGKRAENVGIVAMDVRRSLGNENDTQTFVAMRNAGTWPRTCNLELYRYDPRSAGGAGGEANLVDVREVKLAPRGAASEVIDTPGGAAGLIEARLDVRDDLEVDNVAYAQMAPRRDVHLLLVSAGHLFLEKALVLDPRVKVSRVPPDGYAGQKGYDVVVFDRVSPRVPGPGNPLYIAASGPGGPVEVTGRADHPSILDVKSHPLTRFVTFPNTTSIEQALTARPLSWAQTLVEANSGPLVVAGEKPNLKSVYVGFDLDRQNTNFGLKVGFPIFISNCVQWLAARPGRSEGQQIRAGDVVPLDVPAGARRVTVTDPDGQRIELTTGTGEGRSDAEEGGDSGPAPGTVLFDGTERRGVYTVEAGKQRRRFAVNLLSPAETDTRPADRIAFGRRTIGGGASAVRTTQEIWRWGALLAVLLLGLEWYAYHRRL